MKCRVKCVNWSRVFDRSFVRDVVAERVQKGGEKKVRKEKFLSVIRNKSNLRTSWKTEVER